MCSSHAHAHGPAPSAVENVLLSSVMALALCGVAFTSWLWVGR